MATSVTETGFILIADLSGYTEYLVHSDIEQSSAVIADLMSRMMVSMAVSFQINRAEGDAVLAWAPDGDLDGGELLDTIEGTYAGFRHRALSVHRATSCTCEACGRVPKLDLKMVAHHGQFVRQILAEREELSGKDVILAHRLLKNGLARSGPGSGYALLTDSCVKATGLDPEELGASHHTLVYPHLGDVKAWLVDLDRRWQEADRWVPPSVPDLHIHVSFPERAPLVWSALAPGRSDSCVAQRLDEVTEILEWRPYRRYVVRAQHQGAFAVHAATLDQSSGSTEVDLDWFFGEGVKASQIRGFRAITNKAVVDARRELGATSVLAGSV